MGLFNVGAYATWETREIWMIGKFGSSERRKGEGGFRKDRRKGTIGKEKNKHKKEKKEGKRKKKKGKGEKLSE